jgi:hypothetical protein
MNRRKAGIKAVEKEVRYLRCEGKKGVRLSLTSSPHLLLMMLSSLVSEAMASCSMSMWRDVELEEASRARDSPVYEKGGTTTTSSAGRLRKMDDRRIIIRTFWNASHGGEKNRRERGRGRTG